VVVLIHGPVRLLRPALTSAKSVPVIGDELGVTGVSSGRGAFQMLDGLKNRNTELVTVPPLGDVVGAEPESVAPESLAVTGLSGVAVAGRVGCGACDTEGAVAAAAGADALGDVEGAPDVMGPLGRPALTGVGGPDFPVVTVGFVTVGFGAVGLVTLVLLALGDLRLAGFECLCELLCRL
jgi:hypothetical protein